MEYKRNNNKEMKGIIFTEFLDLVEKKFGLVMVDKIINQSNMDYGPKSFGKSTLRAKNLKVRHILDDSSTTHIISQFIVTPSQISYKLWQKV